MHLRRSVAAALLAAALAGCADDAAPGPEPPAAARTPAQKRHVETPVPRDPRLREDCGGWEPSADLLDAASKLGDAATRKDALAALDAMPAAQRIGVLRAGLRLADDAAARACAARLKWQEIDRWECARCVDLLTAEVLRPGTEADFEEFRSYVGSVELTKYFRSLPPPPWEIVPDQAIGQMHRIALGEHIPAYVALTRHPDTNVADAAWSDLGLLGRWNDEHREEVARREVEALGGTVAEPSEPGLPPVLAAWLRAEYLDPGPKVVNEGAYRVWNEKLRWLWEATPGPKDAELLMELTRHGETDWTRVAGEAYLLLGKLSDSATDAYLRGMATETDEQYPEQLARWALARRGDAASIDGLAAEARNGEQFALAALMEIDPVRARKLVDETLLGADDDAAEEILDALREFAVPGAWWDPLGFDWRRTSFDGIAASAIEARLPAARLVQIGLVVPGCRTRAVAEAVAKALAPGDLVDARNEIGGFLEIAAPGTFAEALRRIRLAGGEDAALATEWLVAMADPETAAAVVGEPTDDASRYVDLARSKSPAVLELLERRVRAGRETAGDPLEIAAFAAALAVGYGLPEDAAEAFSFRERPLPAAALDAVLARRPVDALAAILEAEPDEPHGFVGAVDDPRVRAYLARLREKRDLDHHWYATGQLAVLGDPAARAEFWGAMQDGRYRIMDEAEEFERTLGWDLPATMPFWIEQLKSQCCRIVTGMSGDIVEDVLGVENGFQSPYRTPYRRAREVWDDAGGRFVRSRVLGWRHSPRFVPAPR